MQTEAVIIRDAEDIEEEDFSAVVTAVEHSDDTEDVFAEPVEVPEKGRKKAESKTGFTVTKLPRLCKALSRYYFRKIQRFNVKRRREL